MLWQIFSNPVVCNDITWFSCTSGGQKSKIKMSAGCILSGGFWGGEFSCFFPCITSASCFDHIYYWLAFLAPSHKDSWLHWLQVNNPGYSPHLKILNLITSTKPLWPCKAGIDSFQKLRCECFRGTIILFTTDRVCKLFFSNLDQVRQ